MDFYERLKLECQKNNTTVTALLKEFGINTARTSSWKKGGKTNPSEVKLFADRLNVSTEYLLTGQEYNPDNHIILSKEEIEFIKKYRYLSNKSKSEIRNALNHLYEIEKRMETTKEFATPTVQVRHSIFKVSAGVGEWLSDEK